MDYLIAVCIGLVVTSIWLIIPELSPFLLREKERRSYYQDLRRYLITTKTTLKVIWSAANRDKGAILYQKKITC